MTTRSSRIAKMLVLIEYKIVVAGNVRAIGNFVFGQVVAIVTLEPAADIDRFAGSIVKLYPVRGVSVSVCQYLVYYH